MAYRLGRKAIKRDSRTLLLSRYLDRAALPAAPVSRDWTKGVTEFGAMLNDDLGCCTIAAAGHAVQIWSLNASSEVTLSDNTIQSYYEQWDGYDPNDPSTDQGGVELDVLTSWRKQGFSGHAIDGFAAANVHDLVEIQQAINLFGGVYIGMNVPNWIMDKVPDIWDLAGNPRDLDGGHAVFVVGYKQAASSEENLYYFISWGKVYAMTERYWRTFVDEAYSILGGDWLASAESPSGFNKDQLLADLAEIR